jgi:general secretion pathway protein E
VLAVAAQRLVRLLCNNCKKAYQPSTIYLKSIGVAPDHFNETKIYKAVGCEKCISTGYKGRLGIFEIMVLDEHLKGLILETFDSNRIKNEAVKQKMIPLRQDGIEKVLEGITTMEEVLRVTQK